MGSIGVAAFGGAKGVPILVVIVVLILVVGISGCLGYKLGEHGERQRPRLL